MTGDDRQIYEDKNSVSSITWNTGVTVEVLNVITYMANRSEWLYAITWFFFVDLIEIIFGNWNMTGPHI